MDLVIYIDLDSELLANPMVTLKVGEEDEEKLYTVHKPLIMYYSGYFRGACESDIFEEGVTGEMSEQQRDLGHSAPRTISTKVIFR